MINCLIAVSLEEYGIYGQIMAIKGKYNQIWLNVGKYR